MKIKQIEEDFIVDEIYDLDEISQKQENKKEPYYYFKLIKKNYSQMRAMHIIAKTLNTSRKLIHFAGTKDKFGITSQLISVYGVNEDNLENNIKYLEEKFEGLKLELIGKYDGRINLSDNLGNSFKIIIRDLDSNDIEKAKIKIEDKKKHGILNFFDSQRFGYANNSHIVGKYVLLNQIENAVYIIMTSLPDKTNLDELNVFVDYIKDNWDFIKNQNIEIIDKAIELTPKYLDNEKKMLEHLKRHKNDFPGAFRKIHKKLRTLYVNAYQSYVFNEMIKNLDKKGILDKYEELPLVSLDIELDEILKPMMNELLEEDGISFNNFKLPHMPELKLKDVIRKTKIYPKNLELGEAEKDELNDDKLKVLLKFDLDSGEYATNVVKQLFE